MLILGIESSCDETAAAVVEDGVRILSSVVASQMSTHGKYGGVVPELASREHLRAIVPVVREALAQAGVGLGSPAAGQKPWPHKPDSGDPSGQGPSLQDASSGLGECTALPEDRRPGGLRHVRTISAIAATSGPGLAGSLLVGLTYAKALSFARDIPLIAVNHIEGHIHAVIMEAKRDGTPVELPALALVVSGGHTHLFEVGEDFRYRLLGKTRDDAAGEAYDKVGKLLGYGYPGGPIIDRLAPHGDPHAVKFTFAKMKGNALDFSFSGLKTAVLRQVESRDMEAEIAARRALLRTHPTPSTDEWLQLTPRPTLDLLASFQRAVVTELLTRAAASAEQIGARALIISGGVACNSGLRAAATTANLPYPIYFPSPGLSTDNAAMIAAAAFPKLALREFAGFDLKAEPQLRLA